MFFFFEDFIVDYLKEGLLQLGFKNEELVEVTKKLNCYLKELELFNKVIDLVGADSHDDIIIKHILDSLSAVTPLTNIFKEITNKRNNSETLTSNLKKQPLCVVDVGSGGGFPGIPLAVVFSEINFTLIERMSKRCSFLENCIALMNLKNVTVYNKNVEECSQKKWDVVTFRAFRPLDKKMTKSLLSIKSEDGFIVAYKAKTDKIKEEMEAIKNLVPFWNKILLSVPFLPNVERNLVVF